MRILNKRVKHNYKIIEKFEAGINLTGSETKAVKSGRVDLSHAYAKIINGEAYLINANISGVEKPTRTRKLLLHKKEIVSLLSKIKAKKLTLVPLSIYTKGRLVKLNLALAKAKKKFEKKEQIKKKDIEREIEREIRGRQ